MLGCAIDPFFFFFFFKKKRSKPCWKRKILKLIFLYVFLDIAKICKLCTFWIHILFQRAWRKTVEVAKLATRGVFSVWCYKLLFFPNKETLLFLRNLFIFRSVKVSFSIYYYQRMHLCFLKKIQHVVTLLNLRKIYSVFLLHFIPIRENLGFPYKKSLNTYRYFRHFFFLQFTSFTEMYVSVFKCRIQPLWVQDPRLKGADDEQQHELGIRLPAHQWETLPLRQVKHAYIHTPTHGHALAQASHDNMCSQNSCSCVIDSFLPVGEE